MSQRLLIAELKGFRCRCTRAKKPDQTFCRQCYMALPEAQRRALYKRMGSGYEEAYQAAVKTLAARDLMKIPEWMEVQ